MYGCVLSPIDMLLDQEIELSQVPAHKPSGDDYSCIGGKVVDKVDDALVDSEIG